MANVTDSLIQETYDVKQQLGDLPDVVQNLQKFNSKVQLKQHSHQVKELSHNETNNVMIWGHPTLGLWGANWGTIETAFNQSDYAIIPNNNVFYERFFNETYIDTDESTGSLSGNVYSLDPAEILQSNVVCKIRQPINNIKLTTDSSDVTCYILLTEEQDEYYWIEVQQNVKYINGTPLDTNELRYKVIATDTTSVSNVTIEINK